MATFLDLKKPIMTVSGEHYDSKVSGSSTTIFDSEVVTANLDEGGYDFAAKTPEIFVGEIAIDLDIDANGNEEVLNTYPADVPGYSSIEFQGQNVAGQLASAVAEIYYTVDGKDPKRAKSYLYTGDPINIQTNNSGGYTIFKARMYFKNQAGPVFGYKFTIADHGDDSKYYVNSVVNNPSDIED